MCEIPFFLDLKSLHRSVIYVKNKNVFSCLSLWRKYLPFYHKKISGENPPLFCRESEDDATQKDARARAVCVLVDDDHRNDLCNKKVSRNILAFVRSFVRAFVLKQNETRVVVVGRSGAREPLCWSKATTTTTKEEEEEEEEEEDNDDDDDVAPKKRKRGRRPLPQALVSRLLSTKKTTGASRISRGETLRCRSKTRSDRRAFATRSSRAF